jgi:hypothetical protein
MLKSKTTFALLEKKTLLTTLWRRQSFSMRLRLCCLTLFCLPAVLQATEFKLQPRLCLHYPQQACELQVKVSWQQQQPACLYKKAGSLPLLCGDGKEQLLTLNLTAHTQLELRSQQDGSLLDSRLIRVLQVDLNAGDQLLKRSRASWGNP